MKNRALSRQIAFAMLALLMVMASPFGINAAAAQEMTKVEVVDEVSNAVVTVENLATSQGLFGQTGDVQRQGAGTGFIISKEGYIVTNWHVTTGGDAFQVILRDGTVVPAALIGEDPRDDLAVVQIEAQYVPAVVEFGNSDALKPGQDVLAIGSPLGLFGNTVTGGVVSGTGRNLNDPTRQNPMCQNYSGLIQHDAAINHGNSGGPLFDLNGKVVGVNTLGIPTDSQGQPVQGIFFSIPSNLASMAVQQMIETGTIQPAFLGITQITIDPAMQNQYDLPVSYGALVDKVSGPAQDAGLQRNDIITGVDGKPIDASTSLGTLLMRYQAGDTVTLQMIRDGQKGDIKVTLGEAEYDPSQCQLGQ